MGGVLDAVKQFIRGRGRQIRGFGEARLFAVLQAALEKHAYSLRYRLRRWPCLVRDHLHVAGRIRLCPSWALRACPSWALHLLGAVDWFSKFCASRRRK